MDAFLSATGLVWCGFFSLLMIGIVYLLKRKKGQEKADYLKKIFIFLYVVTLTSLTMEFILQHAFPLNETYPLYTLIVSKVYVFLGLLWNALVIMYYIMLYRKNKEYENTFSFYRTINTIIFGILMVILTLVLTLPVEYAYELDRFFEKKKVNEKGEEK